MSSDSNYDDGVYKSREDDGDETKTRKSDRRTGDLLFSHSPQASEEDSDEDVDMIEKMKKSKSTSNQKREPEKKRTEFTYAAAKEFHGETVSVSLLGTASQELNQKMGSIDKFMSAKDPSVTKEHGSSSSSSSIRNDVDDIDMASDVHFTGNVSVKSSSTVANFKEEVLKKQAKGTKPAGAVKKPKRVKSAEQIAYEDEKNVITTMSPDKTLDIPREKIETDAKKHLKNIATSLAKETKLNEESIELGKIIKEKMIQKYHVTRDQDDPKASEYFLANIPLKWLK